MRAGPPPDISSERSDRGVAAGPDLATASIPSPQPVSKTTEPPEFALPSLLPILQKSEDRCPAKTKPGSPKLRLVRVDQG